MVSARDIGLLGFVAAIGAELVSLLSKSPVASEILSVLTVLYTFAFLFIGMERLRFTLGTGIGGAIVTAVIMGFVAAIIGFIIDIFAVNLVAYITSGVYAEALRMFIDGVVAGGLTAWLLLSPE